MLTLLVMSTILFACDAGSVQLLGSDNYQVRTAAEDSLSARGWKAHAALITGKQHPDQEVRNTCGRLYEEALGEEIGKLGLLPEIDGAWYMNDTIFAYYHVGRDMNGQFTLITPVLYAHLINYLNARGRDTYPWQNYRDATYDFCRDRIEKHGDTALTLLPFMNYIQLRDEIFLARYHHRMNYDNDK